MSYGDKRSSIGFAITAAFVLAGSIPSKCASTPSDYGRCKIVRGNFQRSATPKMLRQPVCVQARSDKTDGKVWE
jgi:hypothetical protein